LYFNKKSIDVTSCNDPFLDYVPLPYEFMDSLLISGEDNLYLSGSDTVIIRPGALLGEEWTFTSSQSFNFNIVKMSCDAVFEDTLFGITDSFKIFHAKAFYGSSPKTDLDGYEIKISKSFGWVTGNYLKYFLTGATEGRITLIGVEPLSYGFQLPGFEDYFHFHPGEIYKWVPLLRP
jgi:hypothetical protein